MVNRTRLADLFVTLVRIDSVSGKEAKLAAALTQMLGGLGSHVIVDGAGDKAGSDTGNVIARFEGSERNRAPLLFNAHMDTVQPGEGIRPSLVGGVFTSDGTTVLGADDKSAVAVIIEALRVIREKSLPHAPLEIVFTVCEEIGLLGAKHLDYSLLKARYGFSLDARDVDGIVTGAPALNMVRFKVLGRDAHAGADPEKGINAIQLAGRAISKIPLGRIDHETTANLGLIAGGTATNIVPDCVTVSGEVRSLDEEKLERETEKVVRCFEDEISSYRKFFPADDGRPKLETDVRRDFDALRIPKDHPVVTLAERAGARIGRTVRMKNSGGGSDANVFFQHGIATGVLGTGMKDVHSVRESIRLDDMVRCAELMLEIIRLQATQA
jgi:tripeptide aminopeptidase